MASNDREAVERLRCYLARRPAARRILVLLLAAEPRKAIARRLGLSQHTVDWHLKQMYCQLGVRSSVALVRIASAALDPPELGAVELVE